MNNQTRSPSLYIGIDLGTSGCRAIAIDDQGNVVKESSSNMAAPRRNADLVEQSPEIWWQTVTSTLSRLLCSLSGDAVRAIAIDGTSASVLLSDEHGRPVSPALMYNDARAKTEAAQISQIAPADCAAHGASSALAKMLWLQKQEYAANARYIMTQSDWITAQFTGKAGISDINNCMKFGYDAVNNCWPDWLQRLDVKSSLLPQVLTPGTSAGHIQHEQASSFSLNDETMIIAGTTDSTAAFLATGASQPGEAVTSLGSTLVLKIICDKPVFNPEFGVYSQPLDDYWLVGGASNSGGAVLLDYFTVEQLEAMTPALDPEHNTGLDYYPLTNKGERFPINDADLQPVLSPRPASDVVFFQGMLEGIARIEQAGYQKLADLGVPYPTSIRTIGGGSSNSAWTIIRKNLLETSILPARHNQAAYGSALLAKKSFTGKP